MTRYWNYYLCAMLLAWGIFLSMTACSGGGGGSTISTVEESDSTYAISFGENASSQLGRETSATSPAYPGAVQVPGDVVQVAAGEWHALALLKDGTVVTWGTNSGSERDRAVMVDPARVNDIIQVAAGWDYSLALRKDGVVLAWSANPTGSDPESPTVLEIMRNGIERIAAGPRFFLALDDKGQVWAFGEGPDDSDTSGSRPILLPGAATAIAAGDHHALAVVDGKVYGWGMNLQGELMYGKSYGYYVDPRPLGIAGAIDVAAGMNFSLALKEDGKVVAWGVKLGDPSGLIQSPREVVGLSGIAAIAAGANHAVALHRDRSIFTWGRNDRGQLGLGHFSDRTAPERVASIDRVRAIAAGTAFTLLVSERLPDRPASGLEGPGGSEREGSAGIPTRPGPRPE